MLKHKAIQCCKDQCSLLQSISSSVQVLLAMPSEQNVLMQSRVNEMIQCGPLSAGMTQDICLIEFHRLVPYIGS